MNKNNLTLAIVTRKRPEKLKRCLESIRTLKPKPDKVLVVDNDPGISAKKVSSTFKKSFSLTYTVVPKKGIPYARNEALERADTDLIGFVDDDCTLRKDWVKRGVESISKRGPKTAYIVGRSLLLNKGSLVAKTRFHINSYWLRHKLEGVTELSPQDLDTKNVILRKAVFKRHNLLFDSQYAKNSFGGFADTDMGLTLDRLGYRGYFEPKMVVSHEEIDRIFLFLKKAYFRGKTAYLLHEKWEMEKQIVNPSDINLLVWLLRLRKLPREYKDIRVSRKKLDKLRILFLKKLYERAYLRGFIDQKSESEG